jgi:thioredoxin 1
LPPLDSNDQNFELDVMDSDVPVVVEFYSPECTHCQRMVNTVDALSKEVSDKVKVVRVNVLENPLFSMKYEVSGIPAFFMIKKGLVVGRALGAMSKGRLKKELGIG